MKRNEGKYKELKFPVIWIGAKQVQSFAEPGDLHTINKVIFSAGYRRSGTIVDADLICRVVDQVDAVGGCPPFWGYRLPFDRVLHLDFRLSDAETQITLEGLKKRIIASERASGRYENMADSPKSYEHHISAMSYPEIVAAYSVRRTPRWLRAIWASALD